jgi:hypothetical protein
MSAKAVRPTFGDGVRVVRAVLVFPRDTTEAEVTAYLDRAYPA